LTGKTLCKLCALRTACAALAVISALAGTTRLARAEGDSSSEKIQFSEQDQSSETDKSLEKDQSSEKEKSAEGEKSSLWTRPSLADAPGGPKEQLRSIGISPDVWVTQILQSQVAGDRLRTFAYGGKLDAFLKIDAEKLGLWQGFHINMQ
jgi:hypothetical protein